MTVLTKTKPHNKRPRCDVITAAGHRCKFHGNLYRDGLCVCRKHSGHG